MPSSLGKATAGVAALTLALALLVATVGAPLAYGVDYTLPVEVTVIKPGKRFTFVSKGTFSLPDPNTDNPTTEGGALCFQGTTGGRTYTLDSGSWNGLGPGGDGSKGFMAKGAECKAIVKDSVIKGVCKPDTGDFGPLPEPGPVNIVLTVGDGPTRYCGECGGESRGNDTKVFKRKDCGVPAVCACAGGGGGGTTTTSTTLPPLVCCSRGGGVCTYTDTVDTCLNLPGLLSRDPGPPGSHCDAATGLCVLGTPAPGPCCQHVPPAVGAANCSDGPFLAPGGGDLCGFVGGSYFEGRTCGPPSSLTQTCEAHPCSEFTDPACGDGACPDGYDCAAPAPGEQCQCEPVQP
jgi:hypothetical protein